MHSLPGSRSPNVYFEDEPGDDRVNIAKLPEFARQ
jgi:hypothetical protein